MSSANIRRLTAALVAGTGVVNIVSAIYPEIPGRIDVLQDIISLRVIHSSQTATVLAGFLLILLADGLRKRRKRALQLTVAILVASSILHVAKGLDYEEAILTGLLALWLVHVRRMFGVQCRALTPRHVGQHLTRAFVLYWGYVFLGFVILRRAVRPAPTVRDVIAEPLRLLAGMPHFTYATGHARWFEDSLTIVACLFALYCFGLALRPFILHPRSDAADIARARSLVRRYGRDTLSYFAMQDGRAYFFDPSGQAFLSYRLWGTVALVGGDPIGNPSRIADLVSDFLEFAELNGMQPCFLAVSSETEAMYRRAGMRTLKIGEEALIELQDFDIGTLKRKVRRAVRHIEELGIEAVTYRAPEIPYAIAEQAKAITAAWIDTKGGAERGFSMTLGRFPRPQDRDCEITVAMQGDKVLGFLSVVPVYGSNAWSLDAMRRLPSSPNGLMEFLVARLAQEYRTRGFRTLSLNFASLANSMDDMDSRMLDETRKFIFENLSGLYQLKSLALFNSKFAPRWRSRYLAYRDVLTFPKLVLAVIQAEDPVKFPRLVVGKR
ncbi:MAG TPA: hypothetical protein DEV93_18190 [Chloroflexi bacterium]|nr:hypothetical protein [Chloroflexota bacterium]